MTGASGYLGGGIVRAAQAAGHEVVALVRDLEKRTSLPSVTRSVAGGLTDAASLQAAARSADGVIHAASTNDEHAGEVDRFAVATMLDVLAGTDRPFVYTSGLWQHGDTGEVPATEDSPRNPPAVMSWRDGVEDLVADAASGGVRTVRIRPSLAYGHGGGYIAKLLAPQNGVVRHFRDGTNRWPVTHVDDLGDLYRRALEHAPDGSMYLGVSGESVRVREAAEAVAAVADASVEAWPTEEARESWGGYVDAFLMDQVATGERARRELGWSPRSDGLLDELRALVSRAA